MTKGKQNSIIEKIAKLLALADPSSGTTEHERELAEKRATELLLKHNLKMHEIRTHQSGGRESLHINKSELRFNRREKSTTAHVLVSIAFALQCKVVQSKVAKDRWTYYLFGEQDNIDYTLLLFNHLLPWLREELKASKQTHLRPDGNPNSFARSFYESAAGVISHRITEQRDYVYAQNAGASKAMVLSTNKAIHERMALDFPRLRSARRGGSKNPDGHRAGHDAGHRADINAGRNLNA